jgi:hypothetical protein
LALWVLEKGKRKKRKEKKEKKKERQGILPSSPTRTGLEPGGEE